MPNIELPEFAALASNENAPTDALKQAGWSGSDQPPSSVLNWIHRTTYDSLRGLLGMSLIQSSKTFHLGADVTGDDAYQLRHFDIDASGIVLVTSYNGGAVDILRIYKRDDAAAYGVFNEVHQAEFIDSADAGTGFAIVDGVYAILMAGENTYYYSPYPYDTWTAVAHAWGDSYFNAYCVADINGIGPSLCVLTGNSLWVTSAASVPDASGDWTEYPLTITGIARNVSFDGRYIVVTSPDAYIYADVSIGLTFTAPLAYDGSAPVLADSNSRSIFNGVRHITVVGSTAEGWVSEDITQGWEPVPSLSHVLPGGIPTMFADPITGACWLFETTGATAQIAASRDGLLWGVVATDQTLNLTANAYPKLHPIERRFVAIEQAGGGVRRWIMYSV